MKALPMLVAIRDYLSGPDHWCTWRQCKETNGDPQYCLMGAGIAYSKDILGVPGVYDEKFLSGEDVHVINRTLTKALGIKAKHDGCGNVGGFNNDATHEELIAALDKAISEQKIEGIPESITRIFQDVPEQVAA